MFELIKTNILKKYQVKDFAHKHISSEKKINIKASMIMQILRTTHSEPFFNKIDFAKNKAQNLLPVLKSFN